MRAVCGFLVLAITHQLAAADSLTDDLAVEGWYGKVGLETGVVFGRDRGTAPLLGGVATLVHINDDLEWVGMQADVLADWNGDRDAGTRWSLGPEAGVFFYGADVSYFGERVDGATHHGLQIRAKLTLGYAAVYVRGAYALRGADEASLDVGLQLKVPVLVRRPKRGSAAVARR
jgi:hypothetical protein